MAQNKDKREIGNRVQINQLLAYQTLLLQYYLVLLMKVYYFI